jgi:hypothetical protein
MLIPGGKGAGNGWGFNREFYPHRRAFVKVFCPGAGDLPFDIRQKKICGFPVSRPYLAFGRRNPDPKLFYWIMLVSVST